MNTRAVRRHQRLSVDRRRSVARVQVYYLVHALVAAGFAGGVDLSNTLRLVQLFGLLALLWLAEVVGHQPVQLLDWDDRLRRSRTHTLLWTGIYVVAFLLTALAASAHALAGAVLGAGLVLALKPRFQLSARRLGVAFPR